MIYECLIIINHHNNGYYPDLTRTRIGGCESRLVSAGGQDNFIRENHRENKWWEICHTIENKKHSENANTATSVTFDM